MNYDHYFDEYVERIGTESAKWEDYKGRFMEYDTEGCIPMWVADMDFKCPQEVIDAVCEKAKFGVYGYCTQMPERFVNAAKNWMKKRHNWDIRSEWVVFSPGVVPVLAHSVMAFTEPGDGVIVQMPVYYPFHAAIENKGRVLKNNQLLLKNGRYEIDFENLEELASDPKTKLMLFCSPHNPVGRVWTRDEISRVCEICLKHQVILVSDEIHSDLLFNGVHFTATGAIDSRYADNCISCYAPSKTFNMAGLEASAIIVPNPDIRARLKNEFAKTRLPAMNVFVSTAVEAAWTYGEPYIDGVMKYIESNVDYAIDYLAKHAPKIKIMRPEGTYLVWIDLRELGLSPKETNRFFIERAGIAVDFGTWFGSGGEGFVRMNFACHRTTLEKALDRIRIAYEKEF